MAYTVYFVTDSTGLEEKPFLEIVEQACLGGVTMVQLREKDKTGLAYLQLAQKVKEITDRYHIPLIINDRIDIALAVDAAGVHVGQSDIPVAYARKLMGKGKIVGATAKTVEQAVLAKKEGADYLGVGAIYPSTTKVKTNVTPVSTIHDMKKEMDLPIVAIGGLHKDNLSVLEHSPIAGVAVASAIMKSIDCKKEAATLVALAEAIINHTKEVGF